MLLLIKRVMVLAHDMLLTIAIGNIACLECLRVRLPSCIVMRLGFRPLLNLLAYVLSDVLHKEIYPPMVH